MVVSLILSGCDQTPALLSPTGHTCGWGLLLLMSPRTGICFSKSQVCLSILGLVNVAQGCGVEAPLAGQELTPLL